MNRTLWKLVRRYVALVALMFWQGGFLFYAAVVVPIGQNVLYPPSEQGFVTRQVTNYLNLSGAVCLLPLAWDLMASGDKCRLRRWGRWTLMLIMAATLGLLAHLHARLDAQLDPVYRIVLFREDFYQLHRMYLLTQTVQWGAAMIYVGLVLWAWRAEDVQTATGERGM